MNYLDLQTQVYQFFKSQMSTPLYVTPHKDISLPYTSLQSVSKLDDSTKIEDSSEITLQLSTFTKVGDGDREELLIIMSTIESSIKSMAANCSLVYYARVSTSLVMDGDDGIEHGVIQIKIKTN